ncbi:lipase family protein [Mycolicibacterium arenosum]|uniref:Lipase family protein n=1 Tax=Mycolicibacterium arenosum TaxID=2952157 RepID=A0ABT1M3R0_9MYCO|nr:lipase family protein [Mycolicibacterium sp. CAU 1645]MCP9273804.1 lipase family protein [Mycolicibacterium sp. CAU 1645]
MKRLLIYGFVAVVVIVQIAVLSALKPVAPLLAGLVYDTLAGPGDPPSRVEGARIGGDTPGSLVSAITVPYVSRKWDAQGLNAARVVYRSTNGDDNSPTVVSGSVFVPKGQPPTGGWPVVSFGHGTIGIENACAPSLSDSLYGHLKYVRVLVELGYAVALADFQGLGAEGVHPYTDSRTAGLNMIDAVRALRSTFPDASDRWVAIGDSQGGGAAWAATEQAGSYAPELKLLGGFAASPGPDMSGLVDKAVNGSLTSEERAVLQAVIESLARLHPDLNRDDFRKGAAARYWNVLNGCTADVAYDRANALTQVGPRDFTPKTPEAADQLRELLTQWALPQKPLSAPLYVWYGGKDPFIDAEWTREALARACALGGEITIDYEPDGGHNPPDAEELVRWMTDRFEGKPVRNDC